MLEIQPDRHNEARRYCVGSVATIDDVPLVLESVSTNYCLFLAIDASLTDDEVIRRMAKSLLERGLAYFCVWGPDCERVHDQFDLERKPREPKGQTVMTTWHSGESLSDALWFFANCVEPDEGFVANCTDWVGVSVESVNWAQEIRSGLIEGLLTGIDAPPR